MKHIPTLNSWGYLQELLWNYAIHNGAKTCICNFMQQQIQWAFLMKSCFKFKFYCFSPLKYMFFTKYWRLNTTYLCTPKETTIWLLKIFMTLENNLTTLCDISSGFLFSRHFLRFINEKGLAHFKGFDKGVTLFLHILVHILL